MCEIQFLINSALLYQLFSSWLALRWKLQDQARAWLCPELVNSLPWTFPAQSPLFHRKASLMQTGWFLWLSENNGFPSWAQVSSSSVFLSPSLSRAATMGLHFSPRRKIPGGARTWSYFSTSRSLKSAFKAFQPAVQFQLSSLPEDTLWNQRHCHLSFLRLSAGSNVSTTQEMQCSDLALFSSSAVRSFLGSVVLILTRAIMWADEHKTQCIWLVIAVFCIKLKIWAMD